MRRITPLAYAARMTELLPLFPLNTLLVPGLVLPLHIFEPRDRALVTELMGREDEDAREFGMVCVREGQSVEDDGMGALYPVGVSAILRQAEELPDGRFDIVTTGARRFRLQALDDSEPLLRAEVDFLAEVTGEGDAEAAARVTRRFHAYRALLGGQVRASVGEDEIPEDPTILSYLVTAAMVLPADERQSLLAASTTSDRLLQADRLLARETTLIDELSAMPSVDLPGALPSVN
jgi:Lon protease-like protein